jgi:hypothetical protein
VGKSLQRLDTILAFPTVAFMTWKALVGAACLINLGVGMAQSAASYSVLRRADAITVDGKLDELSWKSAVKTAPFRVYDGSSAPAELETTARIVWDDEYLYVGFEAKDADVYCTYTGRDVKTWEQDGFEVFTSIAGTSGYLETDGSPTGATWDGSFTDVLKGPGESYNVTGFQLAGRVSGTVNDPKDKDSGFTGEVRIPLAEIFRGAAKPGEGTQLRLNLFRINWKTPAKQGGKGAIGTDTYYAWSPVGAKLSFHQPDKFGTVTFSMKAVQPGK